MEINENIAVPVASQTVITFINDFTVLTVYIVYNFLSPILCIKSLDSVILLFLYLN